MSSQREIVRAGVHIICDHLLGELVKLKRQRRRKSIKRRILKRKNLEPGTVAEDLAENYGNRQLEELPEQLHLNRRNVQLEYGDVTISEMSPRITDMTVQNIKREIKQELHDIPESHCNDGVTSSSFINGAHNTSGHISEDGQQFATLCEVYMPPSPSYSKSHHSDCDNSDHESISGGVTAHEKIRSLKREVSTLRMQLANLETGIRTFLGDDQLLYLRHKSPREFIWSESTIRKAKKIHTACGAKGYNRLREMGFPLPGKSTVAQKMGQFGIKHAKKS